jgi:protein gp37
MAYKSGIRLRVFCASLADVFENWYGVFENADGTMNEWRLRLFSLIIATPYLDWLLLTKRPRFAAKFFKTYSPSDVYCAAQNWEREWEREFQGTRKKLTVAGEVARQLRVNETGKYAHKPITEWPLENVWLGVSHGVDPQPILDTPARIHFQSVEPMLEPWKPVGGFDWCLFGGESGKNARPCDEDWIREALHLCRLSGTVPFIKQMGSQSFYRGVRQTYKHAHGADINEFPTDLRVQEFPK